MNNLPPFNQPTLEGVNGKWSWVVGMAGFDTEGEARADFSQRLNTIENQAVGNMRVRKTIGNQLLRALKGKSVEEIGHILQGIGESQTDAFLESVQL